MAYEYYGPYWSVTPPRDGFTCPDCPRCPNGICSNCAGNTWGTVLPPNTTATTVGRCACGEPEFCRVCTIPVSVPSFTFTPDDTDTQKRLAELEREVRRLKERLGEE